MQIKEVTVELHDVTDHFCSHLEGLCHVKTLPHFSLVQSLTGSYSIAIDDDKPSFTGENGIFIAPPQRLQTITHHMAEDGTMHPRWIFFDLLINRTYRAELLYDFPVIPPPEQRTILQALMEKIFTTTDPCDRMSILYQIAKVLLRMAIERQNRPHPELFNIIDYIQENYRNPIHMPDLARAVHISESHLHAIFKTAFGTTPIAYLNQYRLSRAARLLNTTHDSIESIAHAVGIEDVRYFSKIFKRTFRMTPSAYRNS